jgi:hypothetical protein
MGDPLSRRQDQYANRAVEALETIAEAFERITNRFEDSSEISNGPNTEAETQRTEVEPRGRYDELGIRGVSTGSVAIDHGTEPPELIVHAEEVRHPAPGDGEEPSHVIELPDGQAET